MHQWATDRTTRTGGSGAHGREPGVAGFYSSGDGGDPFVEYVQHSFLGTGGFVSSNRVNPQSDAAMGPSGVSFVFTIGYDIRRRHTLGCQRASQRPAVASVIR